MLSGIPIYLQLLLFLVLFFIIIKASELMISAASTIASILGVSDLVIGLTVVAFGTSAPELAVTTFASFEGSSGIALGNVVGSNIFNVGIILALMAMVKPITIAKVLFQRDMIYLLVGTLLLIFYCWNDSQISRVEGLSFCILLSLYIAHLVRSSRKERLEKSPGESHSSRKDFILATLKLSVGLALVIFASKGVVEIATFIAREFQVSEWLIGTTIVAAGTSLPELMTAVMSLKKGKVDIGFGNIIGSEIFNTLGVIGSASLIVPIRDIGNLLPLYLLLGTTLFLFFAIRTGWVLSRKEGAILFVIAIVRWGLT